MSLAVGLPWWFLVFVSPTKQQNLFLVVDFFVIVGSFFWCGHPPLSAAWGHANQWLAPSPAPAPPPLARQLSNRGPEFFLFSQVLSQVVIGSPHISDELQIWCLFCSKSVSSAVIKGCQFFSFFKLQFSFILEACSYLSIIFFFPYSCWSGCHFAEPLPSPPAVGNCFSLFLVLQLGSRLFGLFFLVGTVSLCTLNLTPQLLYLWSKCLLLSLTAPWLTCRGLNTCECQGCDYGIFNSGLIFFLLMKSFYI